MWRPPPGWHACAGTGAPTGFARFVMFLGMFCSLCEYTDWNPSGGRRRAAVSPAFCTVIRTPNRLCWPPSRLGGQPGPQHLGQVGLTNRVSPSSPGEWSSHRLPNSLRTARSIHRSTHRCFRARNTRRGHVSRVPMACSDCRCRRTGMACQCIRELIGGSNDCGGHLFQPLLWQTRSWTRHAHRTEKAPVLSKNRS